jgi:hypothetical protein
VLKRWLSDDRLRGLGLCALLLAVGLLHAAGALPAPLKRAVERARDTNPNDLDLSGQWNDYYGQVQSGARDVWLRAGLIRLASRRLGSATLGEERGNWVNIRQTPLHRPREATDFVAYDLAPGVSTIFMGVEVATSSQGIRDREYEVPAPPGTFRIVVCGASNDMGYGVPVEAAYPERLEAMLNGAWEGKAHARYDVVNCSVGGYQLLDRLWVADRVAPRFEPDLVLVVVTMHDLKFAVHQALARTIRDGRDLHFEFLRRIAREAGVTGGEGYGVLNQRLGRQRGRIMREAFEELARIGEREGFAAGVVMLDLRVGDLDPDNEVQANLAARAGVPVLRVFDAYRGRSAGEMYLTPRDPHPTVEAHALIADELWGDMMGEPTIRALLTRVREREEDHGD